MSFYGSIETEYSSAKYSRMNFLIYRVIQDCLEKIKGKLVLRKHKNTHTGIRVANPIFCLKCRAFSGPEFSFKILKIIINYCNDTFKRFSYLYLNRMIYEMCWKNTIIWSATPYKLSATFRNVNSSTQCCFHTDGGCSQHLLCLSSQKIR